MSRFLVPVRHRKSLEIPPLTSHLFGSTLIRMPSPSFREARLPDHLRESLLQALIDSGLEIPENLDLDALGFDLLDTMSLLVRLKLQDQNRIGGTSSNETGLGRDA